MVFKFKLPSIIFAVLVFMPLSANAQTGLIFDGINLDLKTGTLVSHPPSPVEAHNGLQFKTKPGFLFGLGLGFWFSLPNSLRLRWEIEASRFRYDLKGFPQPKSQIGVYQGTGSLTSTSIVWNNYFHLTSRLSRHQPFLGFGLGGYNWGSKYYYGGQFSTSLEWDLGLNGTLGYRYRLTEQLAAGVSYRYIHIFSTPKKIKQSQLIVSFSYGF